MIRTTTFNVWICENAAKLRDKLNHHNSIDEDAFQDAYLSLAEIYDTPDSGASFETAFLAAYRKFSGKHISETYATVHPDELFFSLIPAEDTEPEDTTPSRWLICKIRKYIRKTFSKTDVTAFEMKMTGFSCRDISDTIGIGTTAINNATNRIITQTRLQFAAVAL